ncbi:MAG: hypothetical protein GF331_01120 [Chitinivibrionales bacterium]|nr:hypothetical protein [Chitinivibrionales bacterium]
MSDFLTSRAFFEYRVPMARTPSKLRIDGNLREWTPSHRLPNLSAIDGRREFAEVYAGWADDGLSFGLRVGDKTRYGHNPKNPLRSEVLLLWIDTRDARDIHRATRYCHSLRVFLQGAGADGTQPLVRRQKVTWQPEQQPPGFDVRKVRAAGSMEKAHYTLEVHIPGRILHGYDPSECSSIGLFVQIMDSEHGEQFWPYPAPLPFWQDPSLWAAVELQTENR